MQGSARDSGGESVLLFSMLAQTTALARGQQGLAHAEDTPGTSLRKVHLISFPVQQTQRNERGFTVGFHLSIGGKIREGRRRALLF